MKTSIEIDFNNIDIFSTQLTMYQSSWEYQPWKSVKDNRRVVQTTRKKKKKKTVTIITVLVTTLVTFFSIQETFCYRKWQLRLVTPSKSELSEQKKKWTKPYRLVKSDFCALSLFMSFFWRSIPFHFFATVIFSARTYIYCCTPKQKKKKNNNKRLKHKRSILSVVLGND